MNKNQQGGFLRLLILIIVALLLLRYFDITITEILDYFGLSWSIILGWVRDGFAWLKELFISVL